MKSFIALSVALFLLVGSACDDSSLVFPEYPDESGQPNQSVKIKIPDEEKVRQLAKEYGIANSPGDIRRVYVEKIDVYSADKTLIVYLVADIESKNGLWAPMRDEVFLKIIDGKWQVDTHTGWVPTEAGRDILEGSPTPGLSWEEREELAKLQRVRKAFDEIELKDFSYQVLNDGSYEVILQLQNSPADKFDVATVINFLEVCNDGKVYPRKLELGISFSWESEIKTQTENVRSYCGSGLASLDQVDAEITWIRLRGMDDGYTLDQVEEVIAELESPR